MYIANLKPQWNYRYQPTQRNRNAKLKFHKQTVVANKLKKKKILKRSIVCFKQTKKLRNKF